MSLPTPDPRPDIDTLPFWEATKEGVLRLPRCPSCDLVIWYPRGFCPECGSVDVEWFDVDGTGRVYSFSVGRRGFYAKEGPYVLAYVELDLPDGRPGPRMLTNIVDCDPETISVDDPVQVVFHPTESGFALPRFAKR